MIEDRLDVGQRIYIGGRLKTENLYVDNNRRQNLEIMANELYFLEESKKVETSDATLFDNLFQTQRKVDHNSIEMLGFIGTEIVKKDRFCAFSVKTHFITK